MRLIILGPPGAGKGTQATRVALRHGIPAISTGDIFRANIKNETDLGKQVKHILASGGYVTDEITNAIVRDRLHQDDASQGFLLDGYPRTLDQVEELDRILASGGQQLDAVVELVVDHSVLVDRLLLRAREEGRADDTAEVIGRRQQVYVEQTAPLTAEYAARGLLHAIDGDGHIDTVATRIADTLSRALPSSTR